MFVLHPVDKNFECQIIFKLKFLKFRVHLKPSTTFAMRLYRCTPRNTFQWSITRKKFFEKALHCGQETAFQHQIFQIKTSFSTLPMAFMDN